MKTGSKFAFLLSFVCTLFGPIFFPDLHLFFFAPYIIICYYKHTKIGVLWRCLGCGTLLDLLSSGPFFGLTSLKYCLASLILYGQTRNFFVDKLSTLPLMTFLFSALVTAFSFIFTFFCDHAPIRLGGWFLADLLAMPLADALYGLIVFSLPFELIHSVRRLRLFK